HHSPLTTHHSPLTTHHSPLTKTKNRVTLETKLERYPVMLTNFIYVTIECNLCKSLYYNKLSY
ncbi:MAG TPA: hypothetical protein PKE14_10080, partial [Chitinophagales bacterium]|nr:hypothetical protein [Chitinophagales bacterium]